MILGPLKQTEESSQRVSGRHRIEPCASDSRCRLWARVYVIHALAVKKNSSVLLSCSQSWFLELLGLGASVLDQSMLVL